MFFFVGVGKSCFIIIAYAALQTLTFTSGINYYMSSDVVVDSSGTIYIVDGFYQLLLSSKAGSGIINEISSNYDESTDTGKYSGLALDSSDNVYYYNGADIYKYDKQLGSSSKYPPINSSVSVAYGLAIDSAGAFYVASCSGTTVLRRYPSGVYNNLGALNSPCGVAVAASGTLYVADTGNNAIKKRFPNATWITISTAFNAPKNIKVDQFENVYVVDSGNTAIKNSHLLE